MIGRQEQLDDILRAISTAAAGGSAPSVLFLTGEAGIGKTTLLHEVERRLAREVADQHVLTRYGGGTSAPAFAFAQCSTPLAGRDIGEVESLQPWAELMARLIERSARDVVEKKKTTFDFAKFFVDTAPAWVTMVPLLGPSVGAALEIVGATYDQYYFNRKLARDKAPQSAANQQQVFQQYINFLAQAGTRQPLVLAIDDFHWADTSSANLLFTAARELRGRPVVFLIAYRPDDAAGSRGGEGHPVLHIRNELMRYDLARDIAIPLMTSGDLDQLLRQRYPAYSTNKPFEEWLAYVASGNALFITQFLHTLEEDGYVDARTGAIAGGFETVRVPSSAQAVVQERIRRLNEDTREILRYASVEGDVFTAAVLARVTETPQLRLLQKLRLAEETHRFVRSLGKQRVYAHETTTYRFTHTLLHKVLYESLGEEERELLHEAVFAILKDEWETARQEHLNLEGTAMRLAVHADILGQYLFAAEVLMEGASASSQEFAEKETLQQIARVLDLVQKAADAGTNRRRLRELYGQALYLRARVEQLGVRYADALHSIGEAAAAFREIGDILRLCEVLNFELEVLRNSGDYTRAEQRAHELQQLGREHALAIAEANALNELGALHYISARYREALDYFERSLALTPTEHAQAMARVLNNIGLTEVPLGHYDRAMEFLHRSNDFLRVAGNRIAEATCLNNIGLIQCQIGMLDESLDNFRQALDIRRSAGDLAGVAVSLHNVGLLYLHKGNLETAFSYFEQSLPQARAFTMHVLTARLLLNLGNIAWRQHDIERALAYYRDSLETARSSANREGIAVALLTMATLLRHTGSFDECRSSVDEAQLLARDMGLREYEYAALAEYSFLRRDTCTDPQERPQVLREVIEELRGYIAAVGELNSLLADEWKKELAQTEQELRTIEPSAP